MTAMAKTVAASGVPNRAEKKAAIPASVAVRMSRSSRCSSFPTSKPMVPPICSAAPSRPAEPPTRWVSRVDRKMEGIRFHFRPLPDCTSLMMLLVLCPSTEKKA